MSAWKSRRNGCLDGDECLHLHILHRSSLRGGVLTETDTKPTAKPRGFCEPKQNINESTYEGRVETRVRTDDGCRAYAHWEKLLYTPRMYQGMGDLVESAHPGNQTCK